MEITDTLTISGQVNELNSTESCSGLSLPHPNTEHTALSYADAGLSILPVKQDKSPAINSWMDFKTNHPTHDTISKWYNSSKNGVGIICGAVSGNIECLDIDEKYNIDSTPLIDQFSTLVEIQASGLLSSIVHETSQNGGHHLVYRCSTIEGSKKLASRKATENELKSNPNEKTKVLIETRGEGAYFACYPTPGYRLTSGSFTNIPVISEQERTILMNSATALNQCTEKEKIISGYPGRKNVTIVRPGDDFNLRGDISVVLRDAGWKHIYSHGQIQYWRRPGKSDGISASFNKEPNMFYVFTSNGSPLEQDTWYTKFALLVLLKYEGDFKAAAKDLAEQGYGQTTVSQAETFMTERYNFRYNVVTGRVEYRRKGENDAFSILQDYDLNTICRQLEYSHIKISTDRLYNLLRSDFSKPIDPFKEYYESLSSWDQKTDYIAQLAQSVQMKNPTHQSLWTEYLRKWLVGAVGCAIDPGVVNHNCLVLVGPQGYYKTTWLNGLVPKSLSEYLHVGTIDPDNKDTLMHLSECFLINLDELETLSKHELGSLKSIITMKDTRLRRAYGHFADQLIRRASFVGSINRDTFLNDETGSRRFLAFKIATIDIDHKVDMDGVHAQAYYLFKSGFRYWFDLNENATITQRNKEFTIQSTEDELVAEYCTNGNSVSDWKSATEVAEKIAEYAKYSINKTSARDFGRALKKAGIPSKMLDGYTLYHVCVDNSLQFNSTSSGVKSGLTSGVDDPEFEEYSSF